VHSCRVSAASLPQHVRTQTRAPGYASDVSHPATEPEVASRSGLLRNWRHVLRTSNPPDGRVDAVSRWLVLTRASVLPMTVTAAAIAGLLAAFHDGNVRWGLFALAGVGLVLAHVANNLMNDLFDLQVGADTDSYPRALYAPHPVLSGTISRRGLLPISRSSWCCSSRAAGR